MAGRCTPRLPWPGACHRQSPRRRRPRHAALVARGRLGTYSGRCSGRHRRPARAPIAAPRVSCRRCDWCTGNARADPVVRSQRLGAVTVPGAAPRADPRISAGRRSVACPYEHQPVHRYRRVTPRFAPPTESSRESTRYETAAVGCGPARHLKRIPVEPTGSFTLSCAHVPVFGCRGMTEKESGIA